MQTNHLPKTGICDMLLTEPQVAKLLRRIQALPDGRHEIILTVDNGVQDWTVRPIGKVEK
jgi:hypothetical protein